MIAIHPRDALEIPGLVLIDLRPTAERYAGLGFCPGSLSVPWEPGVERYTARLRAAAGTRTPVLVCMSGTRAQACTLAESGVFPYLEGGVLAWAAEGLPLCGRDFPLERSEPPLSPRDFPRHMTACFVGELAEVAIDQPAVDPVKLLRDCFEHAGVSMSSPTPEGLLHVLDHAALTSLELGTAIERVATNLDHMLLRLPTPPWARVA